MIVKYVAVSAIALGAAGLAQAEPLKIALVETLSGPQASTGLLHRTVVKLGIDKINAAGGWNGAPVELIEQDNQGGPAGASDKVKAAIASGAQIIIQGSSSTVAGQITEDVRKHNIRNRGKEVLYLNMGSEALELTGDKCHFYHFRFTSNATMRVKALVQAMKESGDLGTKVFSMNQNYSWGMDMNEAIKQFAPLGGYTIADSILHDLNKIQDFSPYVARIKNSGAQSVITGNWSNDLLLLMKSSRDAGLQVRFGTVYLDQPGNIGNAGTTALGHYISNSFNAAVNDKTQKFAEEYKEKSGHYPIYVEPNNILGMEMFAAALKKVKGNGGKVNVTEIAKALETVKYEGPLGEVSIRAEDHQLLLPMVVSRVEKNAKYKVDGTDMGFTPVKVFSAQESVNPVQATCKMQRPS